MNGWPKVGLICLSVVVLSASCAPAQKSASSPTEPRIPGATGVKRITAAALGNIYTVSSWLAVGGMNTNQPGVSHVHRLLNAPLTDPEGEDGGPRVPILADAVPSVENGFWRVLPDGRMETMWRLRPDILWHDGVPFTTDDVLFTVQVGGDRNSGLPRNAAYNFIEGVEAPDPRTVVVKWKEPYIQADEMFGAGSGMAPLPKHLLEAAWRDQKETFFTQSPYWNREFVGTGPYRLREFVEGSHVVMKANDRYVLGPPKIDEIEVKSIPSPTTMVANILAGTVDITFSRGFSVDMAREVNRQWQHGKTYMELGSPTVLYAQHLNPTPPIVADPRFKRALLHALDRQQMADELQGGLVPVAHSILPYKDPRYADLEARAVRYEYDPRKSAQMIEALDYARGGDGVFRDRAGQPLSVDIVSSNVDTYVKATLSVADFWKRVGVDAVPVLTPEAREQDIEWRATFPGVEVTSSGSTMSSLRSFYRSEIKLPENNFRGKNRPRYGSEELDNLITRYYTTIPFAERKQALGDIVHLFTEQLVHLHLFFNGEGQAISHRLVTGPRPGAGRMWNVHEWDLK